MTVSSPSADSSATFQKALYLLVWMIEIGRLYEPQPIAAIVLVSDQSSLLNPVDRSRQFVRRVVGGRRSVLECVR